MRGSPGPSKGLLEQDRAAVMGRTGAERIPCARYRAGPRDYGDERGRHCTPVQWAGVY